MPSTRKPTLLLALVLASAASVCSAESMLVFSSGGMSSDSGQLGVSGGGVRIATGLPTLFHGTVLELDRRTYAYLVVARNMPPTGDRHVQRASGNSRAGGTQVRSRNDLCLDGVGIEAISSDEIEDGALRDRSLTMGGEPAEAGQWLFLFDAKDPSAGLVPVSVAMPDVPTELEQLDRFTTAYVDELIASEDSIRTFLDG